ncbi:MAG: aminotransferase class V-fold PLP-dependent enzyme [Betaproteobacteria bacterium]|jgi:alanine-glyoxylate transaminase/serine-glyoxylate transaminase/serine-pyruvate transaminase|nr:aminotransferase class V-fold PLP-dependent enzyme [Rhodocyclaceae bacterium]MCE2897408.1 aminotransferase class V-fold PLP-dependent enzyme [Betaproteobacteria bacterium]
MNCAERLVSHFGSQAEVARALKLDRAVVSNWVKSGYIPARWAVEVEAVTEGAITALEVLNEATLRRPVRVKSRGEDDNKLAFATPGSDAMNAFLPTKRIQSFHPPQRTLMGPGPTEIHPRVLTTMSQPAIGYLDPVFVDMMEELKSLLRYVYQTKNPLTFPVSGPGSVGMEYCFVNMVAPGDKVIVMRNGVFGGRQLENVERCGGVAVVIDHEWGMPCDPQRLEDALKANPDTKIVSFVHAETSTGCLSDAKSLVEVAHKYGALTIVDAVTSLGGCPVLVDEWGVDAIYSASQKCLSCTPGLSPVSFSDRVVERVRQRKDKVHSWFMDMNLLSSYWGNTNRTYHHTAPTNSLFALHEALLLIREETLQDCWARHRRHHVALKAGLEAMGLKFLVAEECQIPQMNAVRVPEGVDEAEVRKRLLNEFNLEIGAGLGPLAGKIWRFGIMGYSCRPDNVMLCLSALGSVLQDMGYPVHVGEAEGAAHGAYAAMHAHAAQQKKRVA